MVGRALDRIHDPTKSGNQERRTEGNSTRLAAVILILILPIQSRADRLNHNALDHAALAFYTYEHWDKYLGDYLKTYERDFTKSQKEIAGTLGYIANAIIRKEIRFSWSFP
jgi:hypothetical protein